MSLNKFRYTPSAEIEIEVTPTDSIALRFCDSDAGQWAEPLGDVNDWDDGEWDGLVREITDLIESNASEISETLVSNLRAMLGKGPGGTE